MNPGLLRNVAIALAGGMALAILLLQFVFTPEARAPTFLFALFLGLWVFGVAMLLVAPRFGAAGTTAWGLLSAAGAYRTHAVSASPENMLLVVGSLAAAVAAGAYLWALVKRPSAATGGGA